jgi:hypothetical protein
MADPNLPIPGEAPVHQNVQHFRELFNTMPDVYYGTYAPYLNEFAPNDVDAATIFDTAIRRFPHDQVPFVLIYMGPDYLIRTMHHIHSIDRPFGQPPGPWANTYIGFVGDLTYNLINTIVVPRDTLFEVTPLAIVPTIATMNAVW